MSRPQTKLAFTITSKILHNLVCKPTYAQTKKHTIFVMNKLVKLSE